MKFHKGIIALLALTGMMVGCNDLNPPTENAAIAQSPYSILAETGAGAKIVDRGTMEHDAVTIPSADSESVKLKLQEDEIPTIKSSAPVKETDALFRKLFPNSKDDEVIKVVVNYDAANLSDVIPSFAGPLKLNYLLDPGVTGTVTMSLNAEMSPREVWTLFEQILQLAGAYCEMENQVVHIRPMAKIPQEKKIFRPDSNIEARVVPLKHVSAKEIATQLKSFLSDGAIATALEKQNALMLVENTAHFERLLTLVSQLDRRPRENWVRAAFVCKNVSATQLQHELLEILPVLGFPVSDGKKEGNSGEISIACLERAQAIIASAVTPTPLQEVKKWVDILDKPDIAEQAKVFLYEVVNGKADELVNALSVIFPVESTVMSANSTGNTDASMSSSASTSKSNTPPPSSTSSAAGQKISSNSGKTAPGNSIYDTPVKVFADAVHNRLLIRTTPRTYAMIRAILDRMDTIPTQILMQILVVEIELSDGNEFGMEFSMKGSGHDAETLFGTNFESLSPDPTGAQRQTGGTFTIYNPRDPDQKFGYIRALASKNNMKVLFSPQIVAKSHSKAKISVGKRVPVITNEITDTESTTVQNTSLRRSYQYEDTGIILTVTPQVTKGGLISMALSQTISEAIDNTTKGIDSPIIKEDTLTTELAIRDGRTIIMGGLIKEKQNEVVSSLPFIIDIPFLRGLFGNLNKSAERTEILVLVTATIIREENKLEEMVRRYQQAVSEIRNFENRMYQKHLKEKASASSGDNK